MWYIEFNKNNAKKVKAYSKNYKKNAKASLQNDRKNALCNLRLARRAINIVAGLVVIGTLIYVIF